MVCLKVCVWGGGDSSSGLAPKAVSCRCKGTFMGIQKVGDVVILKDITPVCVVILKDITPACVVSL